MKKESEELLAKEYIDKVKCCDECFCEMFCIENGLRKGREPHSECYKNVLGNLRQKENTRIKATDSCVIDEQPTVDAVLVVHGHWIEHDIGKGVFAFSECSVCGACVHMCEKNCALAYENYCPNCGAKMNETNELLQKTQQVKACEQDENMGETT